MNRILSFALSVVFLLCLSTFVKAQTSADSVYRKCDILAKFPGGEDSLYNYINRNFVFSNLPTKDYYKKESLYVRFIVEKDGSLSDIKIIKGVRPDIDRDALQAIQRMPKWKPGLIKNKPVRSTHSISIDVYLKDDRFINLVESIDSNDDPFNRNDRFEPDSNTIFTFVEQTPQFPGGDSAMNKFFHENFVFPEVAKESMPPLQGTVYASFVVEKDGSLSNIKILLGIGGGCDEEAMRLLKLMPKWIPGKQRGEVVRTQFNFPMRFTLSN